MTTIRVDNGTISVSSSNAKCPHCQRLISIEEVDDKLVKADSNNKGFIRHKCKGCARFMGVAMSYMGEVQSFELTKLQEKSDTVAKDINYGDYVQMDDRFESVHIWTKELEALNAGRWTPLKITEEAYHKEIELVNQTPQ